MNANAMKVMAVRVAACGIAALAVTVFNGYAFVTSTEVVRTAAAVQTVAKAAATTTHLLARAAGNALVK